MRIDVTLVLKRTCDTGRESGERQKSKFRARALILIYWQGRPSTERSVKMPGLFIDYGMITGFYLDSTDPISTIDLSGSSNIYY